MPTLIVEICDIKKNYQICKRNSRNIDDYDNRGCKSYHTR